MYIYVRIYIYVCVYERIYAYMNAKLNIVANGQSTVVSIVPTLLADFLKFYYFTFIYFYQ